MNDHAAASKVLVAYFSHSGNTRVVAEEIKRIVGADLFRIEAVASYPEDYNAVVEQARQEQSANARPILTSAASNIADYDTVILGYPNWWSTMPMPVFTFLESNDLSGKTIAPYCTHEGSGMGRSERDLAAACPHSRVRSGLAIRGLRVRSAQGEIESWLKRTGIGRK
ncbi:MAG: flavodoxin [Capsulimonadaceae bacterium]|nr:flavodoxin [Capsulimonadaceae bacterium]